MKRTLLLFPVIFWLVTFMLTASGETSISYIYDANGNLIQGDGKYYEYNDANKLVKVRFGDQHGQVIAEYFYDYKGQRIKKIENGVTTYYIGKHYEQVIQDSGQTKTTKYYFANSERIAKKDSPGALSYYHSDHLGGTNVVTDSSGALLEKTNYYPFGEIREGGNDRYTYTGKEQDELTDLYYFEARYYNSEIMHFTQADSISPDLYDPQEFNRYAYVKNNPIRYIDPTGNTWWNPFTWFKKSNAKDQNYSESNNSVNLATAKLPANSYSPKNINKSVQQTTTSTKISQDIISSYPQGYKFDSNAGGYVGECGWFTQQITDVLKKYGPMDNTLAMKQYFIEKNLGRGAFHVGDQEIKPGYVIITNESEDWGHAAVVNNIVDDVLTVTEANFKIPHGVDHTRKIKADPNIIIGILETSLK